MTKRTVLPGDEVAVAEEYMPDEGTYEQDGKILSALAGELELDAGKMVAKVYGRKSHEPAEAGRQRILPRHGCEGGHGHLRHLRGGR